MAKPELGTKRHCQACEARFFDLNRSPIVCPKCATVFKPVAPVAARAAARAAPVVRDDEEKETDTVEAETVSLEDAEAGEGAVPADVDVDAEDDDETANDTFLEEEEEDGDNVTDLIGSEIETDEEA